MTITYALAVQHHFMKPVLLLQTHILPMLCKQNKICLPSCCLDKINGGSTSMIVPVWILSTNTPEKETLVYALLDTQSSSTFVDQEVCENAGTHLEPVKKDSIVQSNRVSGLRIRGFFSQSFINLPPAYTRDFIPLERSHILTSETDKKWKHLKSITNYLS